MIIHIVNYHMGIFKQCVLNLQRFQNQIQAVPPQGSTINPGGRTLTVNVDISNMNQNCKLKDLNMNHFMGQSVISL